MKKTGYPSPTTRVQAYHRVVLYHVMRISEIPAAYMTRVSWPIIQVVCRCFSRLI